MLRYVIVIKWHRNIPVWTVLSVIFLIRLEHGSIVIPPLPSLLYLCQPLLSEQKGNSPSLCAKALHLNTRPVRAQTHNHFHLCDWDLKGEDSGAVGVGDVCVCVCVCVCLQGAGGGGALLLLVTVCFPPPQSICLLRLSTPSPQRERNLISLRGTELKDTETLRRCIYLCKAVSLSWLIWISNFGPCCYYIL